MATLRQPLRKPLGELTLGTIFLVFPSRRSARDRNLLDSCGSAARREPDRKRKWRILGRARARRGVNEGIDVKRTKRSGPRSLEEPRDERANIGERARWRRNKKNEICMSRSDFCRSIPERDSVVCSFVTRAREHSKSNGVLNERALGSRASANRAHFRLLIRIINRTWARLPLTREPTGSPIRDPRDQLRDSPGRGQTRGMRGIKHGISDFGLPGTWRIHRAKS